MAFIFYFDSLCICAKIDMTKIYYFQSIKNLMWNIDLVHHVLCNSHAVDNSYNIWTTILIWSKNSTWLFILHTFVWALYLSKPCIELFTVCRRPKKVFCAWRCILPLLFYITNSKHFLSVKDKFAESLKAV